MDTKLEVVVLPVSDVDKTKAFYRALGWREDGDFSSGDRFRIVQMTPPGSPTSVLFGNGRHGRRPGVGAGPGAGRRRHRRGAGRARRAGGRGRRRLARRGRRLLPRRRAVTGCPAPTRSAARTARSRLVQRPGRQRLSCSRRSPPGCPGGCGRTSGRTSPLSPTCCATPRSTTGRFEPTAPKHDWANWYAPYIVARRLGRTPDEAYREATAALEATLRAPTTGS